MNRLHVLPGVLVTLAVLLFSTTGREATDSQKRMDAAKRQNLAISLYGTALQGWRNLAEIGDVEAQYNLGNLYRVGHGFTENDKTAVKWYTLAAKQGHAKAQYKLATFYSFGRGVPQDKMRETFNTQAFIAHLPIFGTHRINDYLHPFIVRKRFNFFRELCSVSKLWLR